MITTNHVIVVYSPYRSYCYSLPMSRPPLNPAARGRGTADKQQTYAYYLIKWHVVTAVPLARTWNWASSGGSSSTDTSRLNSDRVPMRHARDLGET